MDINCDDLMIVKHTLEDSIALRRDSLLRHEESRGYYREPIMDVQRVLELVKKKLADIDANERGMLEIEVESKDES